MKIRGTQAIIIISILLILSACTSKDDPTSQDCLTSTLALSFSSTNPTSCATSDGSITATATGGEEPYQFAINTQAYGVNPIFNGLSSGVYELKVKDKNGCEKTKSVTIAAANSTVSFTATTTNSGCTTSAGSISVNATGAGALSYQKNGGIASSNASFSNLPAGTYAITVSDASGCSLVQNVKVLSGTKFSTEVKPIIDTNCAISGCHVNGGSAPFTLTTVAAVQGRAEAIKSATQSGSMPKNASKLSKAELDAIACWVDDGALNN